MSFLLFGSILRSNPVIVISAFCIVMFTVFLVYVITNQKYKEPALRMLRDMLVGIVGVLIVAINLIGIQAIWYGYLTPFNAILISIILTLGCVGGLGVIYLFLDKEIH